VLGAAVTYGLLVIACRAPVIVHLGLGAFHRAHQALYTEDAGEWEICGVARRRRTVADALRANGWRYTVVSRGPHRDDSREVGVIRDAIVAADDPDAVVARIASPSTHVVTLTITEGGYEPGGLLDLLTSGIAARDGAPLTVLSCDNVPRNGEVLRRIVGDAEGVAFPCTMVDRIVPTPEYPLTVIAEPFSQWVIEDAFAGPRPAWERAGAQLVPDTRPYETLKLRLLNGAHSALAALGLPKGHETVAEAIADPELEEFVRRLLAEELVRTVPPELDPEAYVETMLERFRNPRIEHRLEQIATGAEHKIAQRLLLAAEELRVAGREPVLIERVVASALRAPR
jgi:fructuronate reductase